MTSPYEWKILKWDEKTQTNKEIHSPQTILFLEIDWITSQLLFYMKENNLWAKRKCVILFNKTVPEFDTDITLNQWANLVYSYKLDL